MRMTFAFGVIGLCAVMAAVGSTRTAWATDPVDPNHPSASIPPWASGNEDRFLEFPNDHETLTYDLSTVQMIQPGRFTVIETTIDNPEVMQFELKTLGTLRTYCARPAGKYAAPADLLTLGPPDMPITDIEVNELNGARTWKKIFWFYPYKTLPKEMYLDCRDSWEPEKTEAQLYFEQRAWITNGSRMKELFDCRRGMSGLFLHENDDPSKVITSFVSPGTNGALWYFRVCSAVMHEAPYPPTEPPK